jgi:hypothetical protein
LRVSLNPWSTGLRSSAVRRPMRSESNRVSSTKSRPVRTTDGRKRPACRHCLTWTSPGPALRGAVYYW